MNTAKATKHGSLALFFGMFLWLGAQGTGLQESPKSCGYFVQGFYDWYLPIALKAEAGVPSSDLALKYRKSAFSAGLFQALVDDSEARSKAPGKILSLDFDPFLNTQDPSERYVEGKVTVTGDTCQVEIYAVGSGSGKRGTKPDVTPELVRKDTQWIFVNFHYPDSKSDLLSVLKILKARRGKDPN